MARTLGCNLAPNHQLLNSSFNAFNNTNVNIMFDPAHMIKLERNTFGEKRELIDYNNDIISFKYIELLLMLQNNEKGYLANKFKKRACFLFRKKNELGFSSKFLNLMKFSEVVFF